VRLLRSSDGPARTAVSRTPPLHRARLSASASSSHDLSLAAFISIFQYLIFGTQKHDACVVHVIRNPCYNVIVESRESKCMTLRVYHDL